MFKRMLARWVLMEEAGGDGGAGAGAGGGAAVVAPAAGAAAPAAGDASLTPPESLLGTGEEKPGETTPEGVKPGEEKPGETKPGEEKPIEYTDFTLPEGVALDDAKLGDFKKLATEAKLPQETAQKILDLYTAEFKQITEAPMRAWTDLQTKWRDEVKNDPVIGGANLEKNLATVKTGLKNLLGEGAPAFFEALNITGAGNNPEIVRGLLKAAAPHAPATAVNGNPGKGGGKTAGATLYPTMNGLGNGHEG